MTGVECEKQAALKIQRHQSLPLLAMNDQLEIKLRLPLICHTEDQAHFGLFLYIEINSPIDPATK